jgi:hypothetical protein
VAEVGPIYAIPTELDFREDQPGGTTRTAWLFNPFWNNGPAFFGSITIQGNTAFSIDSGATTCESTIPVGGFCAIVIQFNPSAGGPDYGELVIHDTASNSPQIVYLDMFGGQQFGRP